MGTEHDIYRSLRLNRLIVYSVLAISLCVCIAAFIFSYRVYKFNMNHALVISADGKVVPLEFVDRNRVIEIQMREHLRYFFASYYSYDQNNMIDQREAGLWLIAGEDGQKLEAFYEDKGWYNDIIRKSLNQQARILPETIEFAGTSEPYSFKCTVEINVWPLTRKELTESFQMNVVGMISLVEPTWPVNTEGMLIHNYRESPWTKIATE